MDKAIIHFQAALKTQPGFSQAQTALPARWLEKDKIAKL